MPLLTTTRNGKKEHKHIVYLRDEPTEGSLGFVAEEQDHTHELIYIPESQPILDEAGNVIEPAQPAKVILAPGGDDGHSHDLKEYETKFDIEEENDSQKLKDVLDLFCEAGILEDDSMKKAEESEGFYDGTKQWQTSVRNKLESEKRAVLTFNYVEPEVDTLGGIQREHRQDWYVAPAEGGDQSLADLINPTLKYILEKCNYFREESQVFIDTIIGRGVFNTYVDFDDTVLGDIVIERFPYLRFRAGPHEKTDLSDCEYVCVDDWCSLSKIKSLYPDKAADISSMWGQYLDAGGGRTAERNDKVDAYKETGGLTYTPMTPFHGSEMVADIARKQIRRIECTRKVYHPSYIVTFADDGFIERVDGWSEGDVKKIEKLAPGFNVTRKDNYFFRITTVGGGVVLEDEYPADIPYRSFSKIPVYAKKRGNRFWGKIESIKDPQREINKRRSQFSDIVNRAANDATLYDKKTFDKPSQKKKFIQNVATPGAILEVGNVNNPPVRWSGAKIPAELVEMMSMDRQTIKELMNISVDSGGANQSGIHLYYLTRAKLQGNEFLFEGLFDARRALWKIVRGNLKKYYPAERIFSIVGHINSKQPNGEQLQVGGKDFGEWTLEEVEAIYDSSDLSELDLILTESSYSPTQRLAVNSLLSEALSKGANIPMDAFIDTLPIPDKEKQKIFQAFSAQAEADSQEKKLTRVSELLKPLVGKVQFPPELMYLLFGESIKAIAGATQDQGQPPAEEMQ